MQATAIGSTSNDLGKLILRMTLALLILFHGVAKIISGPGFVTALLARHGLPSALGYLVYTGEVIAPLLMLFGVGARLAALLIAIWTERKMELMFGQRRRLLFRQPVVE